MLRGVGNYVLWHTRTCFLFPLCFLPRSLVRWVRNDEHFGFGANLLRKNTAMVCSWHGHGMLLSSTVVGIRTRETAGRPGDAVYFGKIKKVFEETGLFEVRKSFR